MTCFSCDAFKNGLESENGVMGYSRSGVRSSRGLSGFSIRGWLVLVGRFLARVRLIKWFKGASVALVGLALLLGLIGAVYGVSKPVTVESNDVSYDYKTAFIQSIASDAQELGRIYDLYPSVMIAQAIQESAYGTSGLSVAPYNNLFGIKGSYNGMSVTMKTWEDDGYGNAYNIYAPFRSYPSKRQSLEDYASVLRQSWFSGAWRSNTNSYMDATSALTGVYATDTNYANSLNYLIRLHGLDVYDTLGYGGSNIGSSVWNGYRGKYTDESTLAVDEAYALKNGISVSYPKGYGGVGTGVIWNKYRGQYTTQEVLDEDVAWDAYN